VLCTILHAFTHAYNMMLVPLYLMVQKDLGLSGIKPVALIVTIYGVVYFLLSYLAGMAADRFDRRLLLGLGLLGNAAAVLAMGYTHEYSMLIVLAVCAGVCGTIFHPAANALVPAHYPRNPGLAIGLLGIGAGLGFWAGPQFAGWRAQMAGDWHRPMIEAGWAGLIIGVIFLLIAKEVRKPVVATPASPPPTDGPATQASPLQKTNHFPRPLMWRTIAVAVVLSARDMAGVATMSLMSIYLAKAFGLSTAKIGFIVGTMMLSATIVNPIAVLYTPGKRRLPALSTVLVLGGCIIATIPFWPVNYVLPVMLAFMGLQLGSYALSDAATIERVTPQARGRVVGLFLTIAGTFSSLGPWIIGWWTDRLGEARSADPHSYVPQFATMAVLMFIGACSSPFIARLGKPGQSPPPDPITETTPATMTAVG
jgi:MFS family permease